VRDPLDALTEATRMSILQGRFEALHLGAAQVEPLHMVIGVLRSLEAAEREALATDPARVDALCAALGATATPAPLSTADIEYDQTCHALVAAAIAVAGDSSEANVEPLHLLLGAHDTAGMLPELLARHDLTATRIADALGRRRPPSR
jgi:hypothetical protein